MLAITLSVHRLILCCGNLWGEKKHSDPICSTVSQLLLPVRGTCSVRRWRAACSTETKLSSSDPRRDEVEEELTQSAHDTLDCRNLFISTLNEYSVISLYKCTVYLASCVFLLKLKTATTARVTFN